MIKVEKFFNIINEKKELEDLKKHTKKIFTDKFISNIKIIKRRNKKENSQHRYRNDEKRTHKNCRYYL